MGRFTLRDEGKTIGLGKVLRYKPAKMVPQIQDLTLDSNKPTGGSEENKGDK